MTIKRTHYQSTTSNDMTSVCGEEQDSSDDFISAIGEEPSCAACRKIMGLYRVQDALGGLLFQLLGELGVKFESGCTTADIERGVVEAVDTLNEMKAGVLELQKKWRADGIKEGADIAQSRMDATPHERARVESAIRAKVKEIIE